MMRRSLFVFALVWGLLTLFAFLAHLGVMNVIGFYAHVIPATFVLEQLGSTGDFLLSGKPFVGSGHGPPHLGILGMLVFYVIPLAILILIARRAGHVKGRRSRD